MIVRQVATDAMKGTKTCGTCAHLILAPREGSKRFNYICGLSGLIAGEERRIGNCGRFGVLWADQTPVVVAGSINVIGSIPRNDTPSEIAVNAANAASQGAAVIAQVLEDAQKVQTEQGGVPIVVVGR